jgi:hypothetical protein
VKVPYRCLPTNMFLYTFIRTDNNLSAIIGNSPSLLPSQLDSDGMLTNLSLRGGGIEKLGATLSTGSGTYICRRQDRLGESGSHRR